MACKHTRGDGNADIGPVFYGGGFWSSFGGYCGWGTWFRLMAC